MDDKTLLDALAKEALLSEELAQKIRTEAEQADRSAEEILYERGLLDEVSVAKVKSKILGIPYRKVDSEKIPEEVLSIVPAETARNYDVSPIELKDNMLIVGMVRPWDTKAQDALRFIAKRNKYNLGVYVITPTDLEFIFRKYSPYQSEIEKALKSLNIQPGSGGITQFMTPISLEEEKGTALEEAPIIKIVSSTLKEAVGINASDIHIEPQRKRMRIRFRIDGILQEVSSFPSEIHHAIVSRVKILSNLKIDEMRVPQDGRFRTVLFDRDIDFRVATFPTPAGEKVAIRVLDPSMGLKSVGDLGLVGKTNELAQEAIEEPYGMVLITGPTGSGKTTTLYSLMQILNKEDTNVVSLEDPVEYFISGVNQSQVQPGIGYTFASGLRQILRQDPDVIMVGEIRDNETAELAVHAALTGHIVLATLHTNDAVGVIPRLVDMEVQPFLLPSAVNLMISQRLVRRICENCKEPVVPPQSIQVLIKKEMDTLPASVKTTLQYKEPYQVYRAKGCKTCNHKGFVGRMAIFEGFKMTRELEEIINTESREGNIRDEANRQEMVTLRQDGVLKALSGLILIEDVLRETSESK